MNVGSVAQYESRFLAYFDILGFRRWVEERPLFYLLDEYDKVRQEAAKRDLGGTVQHKWFSDTFVFYTQGDSREDFLRIDSMCHDFFLAAFRREIPLRGALAIGPFYADEENQVFLGPVMIDAYDHAECSNWIGFILAPSVEDKMRQYKEPNGRTLHDLWSESVYMRYPVPFGDQLREAGLSAKRSTHHGGATHRDLLAYRMDLSRPPHPDVGRLPLKRLQIMEGVSTVFARHAGNPFEERVRQKYTNTKEFLKTIYPALREGDEHPVKS